MYSIIRTNSENADFQSLVSLLDAYLEVINGDSHSFFNQYNQINVLKHTIVLYDADKPIACGAIKQYEDGVMEVKRMYVLNEYRGKGVAQIILSELEKWAAELGNQTCILETARTMTSAVKLYQKSGYEVIPNYGQYKDVAVSICFKKNLNNLKHP